MGVWIIMHETDTETLRMPKQKEVKKIPVICSWCNKMYKIVNWKVEFGKKTAVTHGICRDCLRKNLANYSKKN